VHRPDHPASANLVEVEPAAFPFAWASRGDSGDAGAGDEGKENGAPLPRASSASPVMMSAPGSRHGDGDDRDGGGNGDGGGGSGSRGGNGANDDDIFTSSYGW